MSSSIWSPLAQLRSPDEWGSDDILSVSPPQLSLSASAREFTPSTGEGFFYLDDQSSPPEGVDSLEAEILELLRSNYPDCSSESLQRALYWTGFDLDKALLLVAGALSSSSDGKKPCRHYLQGECLRADCTFRHDCDQTTCFFWLLGWCRNGESCPFLHDLKPSDALDEGEQDEAPSLFSPEEEVAPPEEEFPALAVTPPVQRTNWGGRSFVSVAATPPKGGGQERGGRGPGKMGRQLPPPPSSTVMAPGKWKSSDLAEYHEHRRVAGVLARQRNKYFIQATEAYKSGRAKEAAALAKKGRELNREMKEEHSQAARGIFNARWAVQEERNPIPSQLINCGVLDLHGLHVSEAVAILEEELVAACESGLRQCTLLTGSGHHSSGSNYKARLLPAVEAFCLEWGLPYERVLDKAGHCGGVTVQLLRQVLIE
ncbi:unnamed protein product [Chrysoparadoxa australica]